MVNLLRKLASPILKPLEAGDEPYSYKPLSRKVLIAVSVLFTLLATLILISALGNDLGYLFPVMVFYGVGLTGIIVGLLGNDRAVAKIWGNK